MQGSPQSSGSPIKDFLARHVAEQSSMHKAGHYQVSFNDLNSLVEDDVAEEEMHHSFSPATAAAAAHAKPTPMYFEAVEIDIIQPAPAWEGRIAGGGSATAVPTVRTSNKMDAGPALEKYRPPPGHFSAASTDMRKSFLYDSVDKEHHPSSVWEHILRSQSSTKRPDEPITATAAAAVDPAAIGPIHSSISKAASAPPAAIGGSSGSSKHVDDDDHGMGGAGGGGYQRPSDSGSNVSSSSNVENMSARMSLDSSAALHGDYGGHAFNTHGIPMSNAFDATKKVDPAALTALEVAFGDTLGDAAVITQLTTSALAATGGGHMRFAGLRSGGNAGGAVANEAAAVATAVDALEAALDAGYAGEGGYVGSVGGGGGTGYLSKSIGPMGLGAGGGGYGVTKYAFAPPPPPQAAAGVVAAPIDTSDSPWEAFINGWWDTDKSKSKAAKAGNVSMSSVGGGGVGQGAKEGSRFPVGGLGTGFAAADTISAERRRMREEAMNFMSYPAG